MRRFLKRCADMLATLLVLPAFALYQIAKAAVGSEKAFIGWTQTLSLVPGLAGIYLRRAFYRLALAECGYDAHVGFGTVLSHSTVRIGCRVYVGCFCSLGDITLEDDVLVSSHVSIINGARQHGMDRLNVPIRQQPGVWPRITIGGDSWIGERAVVMADVGAHCVIGAGAVVVDAVPDYAVAVGVPARVVRYRKAETVREFVKVLNCLPRLS
jgi:acetyltransferase-like isoleucine patch superfamily enzyme